MKDTSQKLSHSTLSRAPRPERRAPGKLRNKPIWNAPASASASAPAPAPAPAHIDKLHDLLNHGDITKKALQEVGITADHWRQIANCITGIPRATHRAATVVQADDDARRERALERVSQGASAVGQVSPDMMANISARAQEMQAKAAAPAPKAALAPAPKAAPAPPPAPAQAPWGAINLRSKTGATTGAKTAEAEATRGASTELERAFNARRAGAPAPAPAPVPKVVVAPAPAQAQAQANWPNLDKDQLQVILKRVQAAKMSHVTKQIQIKELETLIAQKSEQSGGKRRRKTRKRASKSTKRKSTKRKSRKRRSRKVSRRKTRKRASKSTKRKSTKRKSRKRRSRKVSRRKTRKSRRRSRKKVSKDEKPKSRRRRRSRKSKK